MTTKIINIKNSTTGPNYDVLVDEITLDSFTGVAQMNEILARRRDTGADISTADGGVDELTMNKKGKLRVVNNSLAQSVTGTITGTSQDVSIDTSEAAVVSVAVMGTYAGINLNFEVSFDGGTTWWPTQGVQSDLADVRTGTGTLTNTVRAWDVPVPGADQFRARSSSFTSGAMTVYLKAQSDGTDTIISSSGPAIDAPVLGNPFMMGVRAANSVPTAMSADNDICTPWADRNGALVTLVQERLLRVTATPTISTTIYAAADQVGTLMTFTNALLNLGGRPGRVVNAVITDRSKQNAPLTLWLFANSPTIATTDNNPFDLTDANLEAAGFLGFVDFLAANYRSSVSNSAGQGSIVGPKDELAITSGTSTQNLFGILTTSGTPTYAGTTDLVVSLTIQQM